MRLAIAALIATAVGLAAAAADGCWSSEKTLIDPMTDKYALLDEEGHYKYCGDIRNIDTPSGEQSSEGGWGICCDDGCDDKACGGGN